MWRALLTGALIRWCSMLPVLSIVLAPRWIGAYEFGIGAMVMSIPYLVQGICESIIVTMCIADFAAPAQYQKLIRVRNELRVAVWLCGAATCGYACWCVPENAILSGLACGLLAAVFLWLAILNTWLIGMSYALQLHAALMCSLATAGILQLACFWWLRDWGAGAMIISLVISQCAHLLVSCSFPTLRRGLRRFLRAKYERSARPDYVSTMLLRVPHVLLNTGTLVLAGICLPPMQTAAVRMSVGLAGALQYAFPISSQMLQSILSSSQHQERRRARRMLAAAFAGLCAVSVTLSWFAEGLLGWLLHDTTDQHFDGTIFLGMPCFLLMQPVATYLFATRQRQRLLWASGICCLAFFGAALTGDPGWASTVAAVAQVAAAVTPRARVMITTAGRGWIWER